MSIYVDTANLRAIEDAGNYPFVEGITTNPKLMAKAIGASSVAKEHFYDHILKIKNAFPGQIFVQTNKSRVNEIVREAMEISEILTDQLVIKVPATLPGLQAIEKLSANNIRTAATAVFTGVQAYFAMQCGAEFVIPYYSRIMNTMTDGLEVISDILDISENGGFDAKVLVASLKSPFDVLEVLRVGVHAVTISPDLLSSLLNNTHTLASASEFESALTVVEGK